MRRDLKVGYKIRILSISNSEIIRDNDERKSDVENIFLECRDVHIVGKTSKYITVACYDGEAYPDDNFYVMKLYSGELIITKHFIKNTRRGAIYYKEDYFGYVGEDDKYVYLAHYAVYRDKIEAMRKVDINKFYKHAISIDAFDYAKEHYEDSWGLVGKEIE